MSSSPLEADRLAEATQAAIGLLKSGRAADAEALLRGALRGASGGGMAWLLLAKAQQMRNDFAGMAESASAARSLQPTNEQARELELEALILKGDLGQAKTRIEADAQADPNVPHLGRLAERAVQIADYDLAVSLLQKALESAPNDPGLLFNLAAAKVALGQLDEAQAKLEAILDKRPLDGDALYNLVTLNRQNSEAPTVARLQRTIPQITGQPAEMAARFAHAKAHEDCGDHQACWSELERANNLRRQRMRYDVREDAATMQKIAASFGDDQANALGFSKAEPIFVVGMPRSGTTLIDRVFASHPDVVSVGEVNDMALAIMEEVGEVASKDQLVTQSAVTDPAAIGANYMRRMEARVGTDKRSIDKTPLNFLYIGVIARALPDAAIVHVERDPRDIAFAVYKTLFQMGYPFAYSLSDIAEYMIAKHQLMQHWFEQLPGRIVRITYEDIVSDLEGQARRLLSSAGLEWDPRVLEFHREKSPSATASAAQVRQPVHTRSVGAWKRHAEALKPITDRFEEAGML
ncbi:MAG: sulfotransferase [Pseudomonadota bacterium]